MVAVIVDCAIYRDGKREDVSEDDLRSAFSSVRHEDDGSFVWVGLYQPGERDFARLSDEFPLHSLAVEDAVKAHQRPKLERHGDALFLVLKTLHYVEENSSIEIGEIMVFFGRSFVVTVRHGESSSLGEVRRRLEDDRELLRYGPGAVVYAVCDQIVDAYGTVAEEVDQDVEEIEDSVFSPARTTGDAGRIYSLKRQVLSFRRSVLPLDDPMRTLSHDDRVDVPTDLRPYFRDVADHVARVGERVEGFDNLLTTALNANLTQVTLHQNDNMRRISAVVALISVPTLVFAMYGMNFRYIPALDWHYAYFAVVGGVAAACALLFLALKRSGWL